MTEKTSDTITMNTTVIYDFVFIGLGASNSLIVLALLKNGALQGKKVGILEMDGKNTNDKTYCFWANPNDAIVSDLASIISYSYTQIQVNSSIQQNIEAQPYRHIRSIDLYNFTAAALQEAKISVHSASVDRMTFENDVYTLHGEGGQFLAYHIFDSRPPQLKLLAEKDIYLHQSFYGLHIRCEKDVFQAHAFEMMNFKIEQGGYTQFIYVLPYSQNEALIELTRFGIDKIETAYARAMLEKLIANDFGAYDVLAEEVGCIPMTTFVNPPSTYPGMLHTGGRGNLIKPSTGYGFKNMYSHAQVIAQRIASGDYKPLNQITFEQKIRFQFYDTLLLIILSRWPDEGKKIFTSLFKKQKISRIFLFLDEKTRLLEELKIFLSLPILPFLKALVIYFTQKKWLRYIYSLFAVLTYLLIESFNPTAAKYFSYLLLGVGLLSIGIPHGALDHLLLKDKKSSLFIFIAKYLSIIALYFVVWLYFPLLSLLIFILFSSFHFGESELEEAGIKVATVGSYTKAFVLGLSVLTFIITTHLEESMRIISTMSAIDFSTNDFSNNYLVAVLLGILSIGYILFENIKSKKYPFLGLAFVLAIGIKIPLALAFGVYFILQHSYNAWGHLQKGLRRSPYSLFKEAAPYTLGAMAVLIAIVAYTLNTTLTETRFWSGFFIFLACISLPHFLLMHLFYKSKYE
jgi:lycopene beta-cyclase